MIPRAAAWQCRALGDRLDEDARWSLIDFLRARNAAANPSVPRRAPDLLLRCGVAKRSLGELRGTPLRLDFLPDVVVSPAAVGAVSVRSSEAQRIGTCTSDDPEAAGAYALTLGVAPSALAGLVILVDARGWLRDALPVGRGDLLGREVAEIAAHPLGEAVTEYHHH